MEFQILIDRHAEKDRIAHALMRENPQFIVIYGRRRIGKSTLIRHVVDDHSHAIYFLSDTSAEAVQRDAFSKSVSYLIPDFDKASYPSWEVLLRSLNNQLKERVLVCLDEFPYLVKSCPSLPSILQKLLNERILKFDLLLCGSSQQLMHGYVLNRQSPLYGLAHEIIRMRPIPAPYIRTALDCNAVQAVEEYAVWGGVPRYWELRRDYPDMESAIRKILLDPQGVLMEEPQRLLRDDMRDTLQSYTLLTIIGNGAHKVSEIAARTEKDANAISEPLAKLKDLGYLFREIPFGENPKKSRRGLYYIDDSLLRFHYHFIVPYRSLLEMGKTEVVAQVIQTQLPQFIGQCWELLCRQFVSGNIIGGIAYNVASRWWGKVFPQDTPDGRMVELDVVAESIDKKHILIGECKWTHDDDANRIMEQLKAKTQNLPFIKRGQTVHRVLFMKEHPAHSSNDISILYPEDIMSF